LEDETTDFLNKETSRDSVNALIHILPFDENSKIYETQKSMLDVWRGLSLNVKK
jgi:hypothetical protein